MPSLASLGCLLKGWPKRLIMALSHLAILIHGCNHFKNLKVVDEPSFLTVFCLLILVLLAIVVSIPSRVLLGGSETDGILLPFLVLRSQFRSLKRPLKVSPILSENDSSPMKLGTWTPRPAETRTQCSKTWSESSILLNCRQVWSPVMLDSTRFQNLSRQLEPTSMILKVEK